MIEIEECDLVRLGNAIVHNLIHSEGFPDIDLYAAYENVVALNLEELGYHFCETLETWKK